MKVPKHTVRFSAGISTFAMAMVLLSSMMIVTFYYYQDTTRTRERTVRRVAGIIQQIENQTRVLTGSVFMVLDTLVAISDLATARDDAERSLKAILAPIVIQSESITSAYIGYSDGELAQIVPFAGRDNQTRLPYRASVDAAYAMVHVREGRDANRLREVQAHGASGRDIGAAWSEETDYDARQRPWFRANRAAGPELYFRTDPYVFAKSRAPGITVSRNLNGVDLGTAGVDLDLGSLNAFLSSLRLTPSSRLAIVSPNGTLLSHTQIDPVMVMSHSNGDVKLSLRKLTAAMDPALHALSQLPVEDAATEMEDTIHSLSSQGEIYLGRSFNLNLGGAENDRLLIAVPWNEVAAPLSSARNLALLATAGLAAFVMILTIFVGRKLARPMERLTEDAQAMGNLEFSDNAREISSPFLEVQKLSEAMRTTNSTIAVLARYVPRSLVTQLVESGTGGDLGGTRRELAFLFTDIEGFTTLSEKADSATMMRQLSEYFECISNAILHHNGTIDKYIGDAVMAFWNAPRDDLEMASNACKAALLANNGLTTLNIRWDIDGRMALATRYGLHVGTAVVGNVGCSDRLNYTAMGAAVNAAARLEGLNKFFGTTILASDAVRRRTGTMFVWRRIGSVNPKGVLTPLTIYELAGLDAPLPDMPGIRPVSASLRARVDEWNALFEIYLNRDWTACGEGMEDYLSRFPDDRVAEFYLERVRDYAENAPPPDWNGAEEFTSK